MVYSVGDRHAVKVISDRYLDEVIGRSAPERIADDDLRVRLGAQQLLAEHEMAQSLRAAGVHAVRTDGLYAVTVRWLDTGLFPVERVGLVMDLVPGTSIADLPVVPLEHETKCPAFAQASTQSSISLTCDRSTLSVG